MPLEPLVVLDGFGHYTKPQEIPNKWDSLTGTLISGAQTGTGYALSEGQAIKGHDFTSGTNQYTAAAAIKRYVAGAGSFMIFGNANTFGDGVVATLYCLSNGRLGLNLFCGAGGLGSGGPQVYSDFSLSFGSVYNIQFYLDALAAESSPGSGFYDVLWTYTVKINGVSRLSGTATTPTAGGNILHFSIDRVQVISADGLGSWLGDAWCTTGELLGQCSVNQYLVVADGGTIQWTPLSGANFSNVQDRVVDDSKYNSTSNVGDTDLYQFATVSTSSIKGVQFAVRLALSGGAHTASIDYFDGTATTILGPAYSPGGAGFTFFFEPYRKSFFSGIDWVDIEMNAMRAGPNMVS